jgi:hypothetical protein
VSRPAGNEPPAAAAAAPDETAHYESLLATGERVLVVRRRHWATFIQAARWFLLILLGGLLLGYGDSKVGNGGAEGVLSTGLGWGFSILGLVGVVGLGWYFLAWRRERYLVTTRRVIEMGGVINKHQRDTSLSMITDMLVGHPWLGRILGYGEIDLLTASEKGTNRIKFLPDADGFKKILLDAKYVHETEIAGGHSAAEPAAAPAAPAPPAPVAGAPAAPAAAASTRLTADEVDASITHLADLRDRGLITAAEFDEKKQDILDRL